MSTTLPLFWHLSAVSKKERIDASVKLVGALEQFQAAFVPKHSQVSDEEDEDHGAKADGLDALNAQDVSYSIRRLVRGLSSPRESSRLGFAVALTELLSRIDTITCSQIVDLIVDSSKIQGSMTGQEERDVHFARLFGLTAVIQSGLLVRSKPLATSASNATAPSNPSSFQDIISHLIILGDKKSWLRESAWWTMGLAIDALRDSDVPWKDDVVEPTIRTIFLENQTWSPEKVAMAIKLQNLYPNRDWQKLFSPSFKNADLLSTGNLQSLARILKESTVEDDETGDIPKSAAGTWKPQVHFVWDIILDQLLPNSNSMSLKGSFQEFFQIVVDESLFSSTSSAERKYWGFQIFQKALTRVTADHMPMLFTKNFMRSWINHLSQSDRYLHKVARQVATEIQSFVQKHPTLGFTLVLQLTGVNGSRHFDRMTKTKTVESVLTSMDADGIKKYIDYLFRQVDQDKGTAKTDIQSVNTRRAWIIEQLAALIRNGAIPKSDEWILSILNWFVVNGLFVIKKKSEKSSYHALQSLPNPAFSDELRQICRTRLLSCLADLTGQMTVVKSDDNKMLKVSGVASDGEFWVAKVLTTIEHLEKDTKHVTLLAEAEEGDQELRSNARLLVERLKKVTGERREAAKGAELLLVATLLQYHCANDQEADAEVLGACIEGASRMLSPEGKKSKKSRQSTGLTAEPALEAVDILVDTVIGFLEKSTAYMRTVGNQAFALLSGSVQETTIDLILTQLERRDPADLAEDEGGDESDGGDQDSEDDEGTSDEEVDSSDGEDSSNEEEDLELRQKIEEALRVNGIEAAASDSDNDSDEEPMDDDRMMAIDDQLAELFRSRANERKSNKDVDAQREATHFKNRVLDMVDTFIKKQPSSPHIFRFILPLADLVAGSGQDERQLSDKAKGLLRSRIGNLKQFPSIVDTEHVSKVLADLHTRARKVRTADILPTLSQCSLYLSKALFQSGLDTLVLRVYRESLADFLTRKNSALNAAFFQDFIRRSPSAAWGLRDDLIKLSPKAINVYRQCQAFQLIRVLIGQLSSIGDRQDEVLTFMSSLRHCLFGFMSNACDDIIIATTLQMKDIFKLGLLAIRQTKNITTPEKLSTLWQPTTWDALRGKLATSDRFKSSAALQTMCLQMLQTSQIPDKSKTIRKGDTSDAALKRKVEDADVEDAAPKKTRRKKVKKNYA